MKTPISIQISSLERLLSDGLISVREYESIFERIMRNRVDEVKSTENGG